MITGDKDTFAISWSILERYRSNALLALGHFAFHIGGRCYGVTDPDATVLAVAVDSVRERVLNRGTYVCELDTLAAPILASAFRRAIYTDDTDLQDLPCTAAQIHHAYDVLRVQWAPFGDESFDDGSYVLQFDTGPLVRLVAYRSSDDPNGYDPATLKEQFVDAEAFYGTLIAWEDQFFAALHALPYSDRG